MFRKTIVMKRTLTLLLSTMFMLAFMPYVVPVYADNPFRGVWINNTAEQYEQLKMNLYDKSIKLSDEAGQSYGYLQVENDFVSDYWIITDVTAIQGNKAQVKYYSLRYGMPEQKESMTVTYNAADGSIAFGEGYTFAPSSACKFVEIIKSDVNIRTAPVTGAPVMKAQAGMTFAYAGLDKGWYKVSLAGGTTGYVSGELANPLSGEASRIPDEAFGRSGQYVSDDNSTLHSVDFMRKGDVVYMSVAHSHVNVNTGSMRYYGTTIYKGKVDGCRLVFTKKLDGFNVVLDSGVDEGSMTDIKPYTVYYSPTNADFVVDGKMIKAKSF